MSEDSKTFRYLQQENVRLRDQNRSLNDYLTRLQQAIRALVKLQNSLDNISSESNLYNLLNQILTSALDAVDSENGSLMLLDEDTGELVFVEVIGAARDKLLHYRLAKGLGVAGRVATSRKPQLVDDVGLEPAFSPLVDSVTGMRTISLICVPLWDGERTLGVIETVNTRSGQPFTEADKDILMLVARLASIAILLAEQTQP